MLSKAKSAFGGEQQKKRKPLWLKILIVIIAILMLAILFKVLESGIFEKNSKRKESIEKTATSNQMNCKSDPSPKFTAHFTDLSKVQALGILGGMIVGSPGRSYVTVKDSSKIPLYAPGDAVLETIFYSKRPGDEAVGEYGLLFKASCEVTFLFDHVDELTDEFRALAPKEAQENVSFNGTNPNKEVKAGTLVGYSNGTDLARTFDFQLINTSKKAEYINPKRWDWEPTINADCPYDYYDGDLKAQHYNLLGEPMDNELKKAENCGKLSKDIAGTASGGWFQNDSTTTKGKWLSLGKNFDYAEFSIRKEGRHDFQVKDYNAKVTPDKIKIGDSVCYQSYDNKWAFVKLESAVKLSIATGDGSCPSNFPSSGVEQWER